jgi:uncharacterized protein YbdZ (MbtH family)
MLSRPPRPSCRSVLSLGLLPLALVGGPLSGCKEQPAPPLPPASGSSGYGSEEPRSLAGRIAQAPRDLRSAIEGQQGQVAAAAGLSSAGESGFVIVGNLAWPIPQGWTRVTPRGSMRAAELSVPGPAGPVEVYWFAFPSGGGDALSNVNRWSKMVRDGADPARDAPYTSATRTINGLKVTTFDASGTLMAGMPGGPQTPVPDSRMLAVFIELPSGGSVAIRMQGPRASVDAAEPGWRTMIDGVQTR